MPKKKPAKPATRPGECCGMMTMVLSEENPKARTGLSVPLAVWGRDGTTLQAEPPQLTYRPTGRNARTFFLNFCPWCGAKLGA